MTDAPNDDRPGDRHCGNPGCNYGHYWLDGPVRKPGERYGRGVMYRCNGRKSQRRPG